MNECTCTFKHGDVGENCVYCSRLIVPKPIQVDICGTPYNQKLNLTTKQ